MISTPSLGDCDWYSSESLVLSRMRHSGCLLSFFGNRVLFNWQLVERQNCSCVNITQLSQAWPESLRPYYVLCCLQWEASKGLSTGTRWHAPGSLAVGRRPANRTWMSSSANNPCLPVVPQ